MMSCMQMASFRPHFNVKVNHHKSRVLPSSRTHVFAVGVPNLPSRYSQLSMCVPICKRYTVVCVFGEKDKPVTNNQDPPWKGVQKTFEDIGQKLSVEDMLRKQMGKQGYDIEEVGGGGSPPGDGDGGGGGGGGDDDDDDIEGFEEPEEESLADKLEEALQITLATLTLIFLYVYLLFGAEIKALTMDFTRFVSTGKKSQRLMVVMDVVEEIWNGMTGNQSQEEVEKGDIGLEQAIVNTATWYDGPDKYKDIAFEYLAAKEADPNVGVEEMDKYAQYWQDQYNESKRNKEDSYKEDGHQEDSYVEEGYVEEGYVEEGYVEDGYQASSAATAADDYYDEDDDEY